MVDVALGCRRLARGLAVLSCLVAVAPAEAQPFSTEQRLGEPAENEAVLWQRFSQVVFDGRNYVVLWENERSTFATSGGFRFAARVSEDGTLLDEHGILVTRQSPSSLLTISAAPWGSLVVYPIADDVMGARLGRDGELFDPTPRVLATGGYAYAKPAVACLDTGCLLVFSSGDNANPRTLGVALDGCGDPVPGTEVELPVGQWDVRAAADGYVAFGRTPPSGAMFELVAVGMTADGQRRFGPVKLPPSRDTSFAFGAGPSGSLALWTDREGHDVRAVCLDPEGEVVGENLVLSSDETIELGGMSTEGDRYRVGIRIGSRAGFLLVDRCGQLLESPVTVAPDDSACRVMPPRVASGERSAFLTWDWTMNSEECEKQPPTASVVPADPGQTAVPVEVQRAGARMGSPALGSDGTSYLAAWYEDRDGATGLYTQALDAAGASLERAVLTIPARAHPSPARTASVAFVGGRYVVELHASLDPYRHEILREPNVAAEVDPRALSRGEPRIQEKLGTPGANAFLDAQIVVHRQGEDIATLGHLTVRVTDASNTPLSAEWTHEYSQDLWDREPRVAFDGTNFGVVWHHGEDDYGVSEQDEQLFMSFDETGQPLLPAPVVVPGLGEYTPSSLTFGGGAYLLTLQTRDGSESLVRLSTEGELLDAEPRLLVRASETPVQREFLGALFDGEAFVFAWSERSISGLNTPAMGHTNVNVRVVRVAADGTPLSDGWVTSSREDEIASAGLASVGDGRSLVGYRRFDDDPAYYALRGVFRILGTGECSAERACSDDACDEGCCVRGCTQSAPALACEAADCGSGCEAGTHCVPGLGCVADGKRPRARVVRTEGCGCAIPERGRGSSGPILALLAALAAYRRARRGTRGQPSWRASRRECNIRRADRGCGRGTSLAQPPWW